jgi:hypothetical protein
VYAAKCQIAVMLTTTKMTLRGTVQTLTEAVTKSNRLAKYLMINRDGRFYLHKHQKMIASINRFTESVILFMEAVIKYPPLKIDRQRKSFKDNRLKKCFISGGGSCLKVPASVNLFSEVGTL